MPAELHALRHSRGELAYDVHSLQLVKISPLTADRIKTVEMADDPLERDHESQVISRYRSGCSCRELMGGQGWHEERSHEYEILPNLSKLVLMVGHGCNMTCKYCFWSQQNGRKRGMTREVACSAIRCFLDHFSTRLKCIFFFGGEPLLNWNAIRSAVGFTLRYCAEHRLEPPRFAIQTNATLLDRDKAAYLKEHNFLVTVSLDGPPIVNNKLRVFRSGAGTYKRIIDGLSHLEHHNQRFDIEATITRHHLQMGTSVREVFLHLLNLGAGCVHIMPVAGPDPALRIDASVDRELASQFATVAMESVSSLTTEHPQRLQYVLYVIENLILGPQRHLCYAGIGTATVEGTGDIYPCYHLSSGQFLMGNIYQSNWAMRYHHVRRLLLNHSKEHLWPCRQCWARNICNACYGAERSAEKTLSAPAKEACLIQREVIDAILSKLVELREMPGAWNNLIHNLHCDLIGEMHA